jgi:hypothetical protein
VPTDFPESDGTFAWEKTTLVLVEVSAGGRRGLGFTADCCLYASGSGILLCEMIVWGCEKGLVRRKWAGIKNGARSIYILYN